MQTNVSSTLPSSPGIAVSTTIHAGLLGWNHIEGVVLSTDVTAGGQFINHAEGVVDPDAAPTTVEPADQDALVIEF